MCEKLRVVLPALGSTLVVVEVERLGDAWRASAFYESTEIHDGGDGPYEERVQDTIITILGETRDGVWTHCTDVVRALLTSQLTALRFLGEAF